MPRSSPSTAPDTGCTTTVSTSSSPCCAGSSGPNPRSSRGEGEGSDPLYSPIRSSNKRIALPLLADAAHRPMAADEEEVVTQGKKLGFDGVDQRGVVAVGKI